MDLARRHYEEVKATVKRYREENAVLKEKRTKALYDEERHSDELIDQARFPPTAERASTGRGRMAGRRAAFMTGLMPVWLHGLVAGRPKWSARKRRTRGGRSARSCACLSLGAVGSHTRAQTSLPLVPHAIVRAPSHCSPLTARLSSCWPTAWAGTS